MQTTYLFHLYSIIIPRIFSFDCVISFGNFHLLTFVECIITTEVFDAQQTMSHLHNLTIKS